MAVHNSAARGFSGLTSLVSSVDDVRAEPTLPTPAEPTESSPEESSATPKFIPPPKPSGMSTGTKVVLAFFGVLVLIGIFSNDKSSKSSSSYSSSSYSSPSPSTYSTPPTYQAPSYTPPAPTYPSYSSSYDTSEDKPPYGTDMVLSAGQIRYCLSQDIRLEGWRSVVNQYSETAIGAFNRAVNDFNGRCGQYRYKTSVWTSVNSSVQSQRSSLYSEGVRLAARNP